MKLTFIGMGSMGQNMAARLLGAGHALTVYNRDQQKCLPLKDLGAGVAATPAEAVLDADIVFSMLADDVALCDVFSDDVIKAMGNEAIHVVMGTVSIDIIKHLTTTHARHGRGLVACPVFGRPNVAAAGELKLCLAGPEPYKEKVRPYMKAMGELRDFGTIASNSMAVKLAGNLIQAALIQTLSESFCFVEKNGVDPEEFFTLISTTMMAAPAVRLFGRIVLDAGYEHAGFAAALGAKDIRLACAAASASNTPMPIAFEVAKRFELVLNRGWKANDWTVIAKLQREDCGLEG